MKFEKHLIQCKCILPQYKNNLAPIFHQFIVFSIFDENDDIIPHLAQCNNCGAVHKIIELCKSNIIPKKDDLKSINTIDEIKISLSEKLVTLLEQNDCDLPTWQMVFYIIENKLWGTDIIISSEIIDNEKHIKYVKILGENLFKIDSYTSQLFLI